MKRQRLKRALTFAICAVMLITGIPTNILPLPETVKESIDWINPFTVVANAAPGSSVPGGAGGGGSNTNTDAVPPNAPIINWDDGDAWEFQVWVNGSHKGSVLLYGEDMMLSMGLNPGTIPSDWGASNGKHSTTRTGGSPNPMCVPGIWNWSQTAAMVAAGKAQNEEVFDKVMIPLKTAHTLIGKTDGVTPQLYDELVAQASMTEEQIAEAVDNGTWKHLAISAEPYGLIRRVAGGESLWIKREALWSEFHWAGVGHWWNIALRLSQVWVTEDVIEQVAAATGGIEWIMKDSPGGRWHANNAVVRDNYAVWWNYPAGTPPVVLPPPPPPDDPDHEEGWDEIKIFEHEIIAGIPNVWEPDGLSEQQSPDMPDGYIQTGEGYFPPPLTFYIIIPSFLRFSTASFQTFSSSSTSESGLLLFMLPKILPIIASSCAVLFTYASLPSPVRIGCISGIFSGLSFMSSPPIYQHKILANRPAANTQAAPVIARRHIRNLSLSSCCRCKI